MIWSEFTLEVSLPRGSTHPTYCTLQTAVQEAIARLSEADREVILMRHFEGLSNLDVAAALKLTPSGATMRHGRAIARLRAILQSDLNGSDDE